MAPSMPEAPTLNRITLASVDSGKDTDVPPALKERLLHQAAGVLRSMAQFGPDAARVVRSLRAGDLFHVVMEGRATDLKQAGGGLLHAWVQGSDGRIREQARLKPADLDPSALAGLSGVVINAVLLELAAKIDALHADIRGVKALLHAQYDGELLGAVRRYPTICCVADASLRKAAVMQLTGDLHKLVPGALERLRAELAEQPSAAKTLPTALSDDEVARTWEGLRQRFALALQGIRILIFCYQDLGEAEAAQQAMEQMLDHLSKLDFTSAASNARLVPWKKDDPPEAVWARTPSLIAEARQRLANAREGKLTLDVTLTPETLLP
jgi:hypothetical protein